MVLDIPIQILSKVAGPEEMKWPSKELYTYNVRDGDSFILDEKVSLGKLKTRNLSFSSSQYSPTKPMNHSRSGMKSRVRLLAIKSVIATQPLIWNCDENEKCQN